MQPRHVLEQTQRRAPVGIIRGQCGQARGSLLQQRLIEQRQRPDIHLWLFDHRLQQQQ
ncbi:hypothetical protein D3C80_1967420 [compost metagenome]